MIRLSIPVNDRTKNFVGEILRELFFDQSRGMGGYDSFDLLPGVVELPDTKGTYWEDEEKVVWHNAMLVTNTDTIEMSYIRNDEHVLIFKFGDYVLTNGDAAVDYTWELEGGS
jgi:hypothetical protein